MPPPEKKAVELKKLAAKLVNTWYEKFGSDYKLLELGFNYLKNVKKVGSFYKTIFFEKINFINKKG